MSTLIRSRNHTTKTNSSSFSVVLIGVSFRDLALGRAQSEHAYIRPETAV